ncbi:hypothetical protein [Streptomyces sp. NPDC051636]
MTTATYPRSTPAKALAMTREATRIGSPSRTAKLASPAVKPSRRS